VQSSRSNSEPCCCHHQLAHLLLRPKSSSSSSLSLPFDAPAVYEVESTAVRITTPRIISTAVKRITALAHLLGRGTTTTTTMTYMILSFDRRLHALDLVRHAVHLARGRAQLCRQLVDLLAQLSRVLLARFGRSLGFAGSQRADLERLHDLHQLASQERISIFDLCLELREMHSMVCRSTLTLEAISLATPGAIHAASTFSILKPNVVHLAPTTSISSCSFAVSMMSMMIQQRVIAESGVDLGLVLRVAVLERALVGRRQRRTQSLRFFDGSLRL